MKQRKENHHLILPYVFSKRHFFFYYVQNRERLWRGFTVLLSSQSALFQTLFHGWKLLPAQKGERSCCLYSSINADPIFVIGSQLFRCIPPEWKLALMTWKDSWVHGNKWIRVWVLVLNRPDMEFQLCHLIAGWLREVISFFSAPVSSPMNNMYITHL